MTFTRRLASWAGSHLRALGLSLLFVISATAVFWFFATFVPERRAAAVDGWRAALSFRSDVLRDDLDRIIAKDQSDARILAVLPDARALLSGTLAAPEANACRARLLDVLRPLAEMRGSRGVALQDEARRLVVSAGWLPRGPGVAGVKADVVGGCRERVEFTRDEEGRPLLTYTSPVGPRPGEETRGCAVVAVDAERSVYPLLGAQVVPGPTSEAVLIQRGGDEILFLSRLRHRADAPLTLRLPVGSAPFAARLALEGKEDFGAFVDYRGVPVLAAVRRLKSAPWGLVVKVDEDEALAPFRKNALESAITGSALLLGLFASAAGFWGALAARGEAEVARSEAREAAGIRTLNAELEERVVERTAQFEAANKELEAFSYSVSHDLRAPLRAVDGFSRILLEDHGEQLDAEGKRLLGVVRSSTRQMGQLIDDLLAFSRVGRKEIAKSDVDMAALASLAFEAQCAEGDDVSFAVGELPHVDVDLPLMRQVWTNLISNSLKFTRPKAKRVIAVAGRTEPGRVVYSVKDNGVGFDMAYTDKLFGVFQRLHSSAEFEGTGVGLALVQRIVHRHGGEVWAEGKVGEGATFSFSLPRLGGSS